MTSDFSHSRRRRTVATRAVMVTALLVGLGGNGLAANRTPALVEAAKLANTATVKSLLQGGADTSEAEPDGTTALHWAAHHGDLASLDGLVQAKADVNVKNRYGVAPIWLAATNGHAASVEALLRAGADAQTTRADSGETVLMVAAMTGHAGVLQRLLAHGADPNAVDKVRSQTALMWAAAERHDAAVRVLVEAGADIEARSSTGLTPLMFAIRAGDISGTVAILGLGADLKATAPDGTTALGLALINAHWELAANLLEQGADPNGNDPRGRPLHILTFVRRAENRGLSAWLPRRPTGNIDSIDLAQKLIARGAKVNDQIDWKNPNYSPDHIALGYFLATNYVGATPLYIAAKQCDVELVKFFIDNGADPKIATGQKVSPLLAAAGIGFAIGESAGTPEEALETVKLLSGLGGDVNAIADFGEGKGGMGGGWNGSGALHGAVIRGAEGLVKWLIEQDVPLDLKTLSGRTALDMARGSDLGVTFHVQPELAEILEKAMVAKGLPIGEHKYGAAPADRDHSQETR